MKQVVKKIEACGACPFRDFVSTSTICFGYCNKIEGFHPIEFDDCYGSNGVKLFPDWCPLEDYKGE
jgi:hypothetical protein